MNARMSLIIYFSPFQAAYVPPDHTSSIPVVKELADGCYDGKVLYKIEQK